MLGSACFSVSPSGNHMRVEMRKGPKAGPESTLPTAPDLARPLPNWILDRTFGFVNQQSPQDQRLSPRALLFLASPVASDLTEWTLSITSPRAASARSDDSAVGTIASDLVRQ